MNIPVILETADTKIVTEKLDPAKTVSSSTMFDLMGLQLGFKSFGLPALRRIRRYVAKDGEWAPSDLMLRGQFFPMEEYIIEIPGLRQALLRGRGKVKGLLIKPVEGRGAWAEAAVKNLIAKLQNPSRSVKQEWKAEAGLLPRGVLLVESQESGSFVWRKTRSGYNLLHAKPLNTYISPA